MDPVLNDANQKIDQSLLHLARELSSIRAGRANPSLIEEISVSAYGARMKLNELGTISAPQHSLLTVQVWDATILKDVQKALMEANLGLNPSVESNIIRIPIPPLTEERRQEFVKLAHQKSEETRISLRQIRNEQRETWKKAKDEGEFGEDELERREKLLQVLIDKSTSSVDELLKTKEEELMQI